MVLAARAVPMPLLPKWRSELDAKRDELVYVEPKWGPVGRETYERTYARPDANGKSEIWLETCYRVVAGNLSLVDPSHIEEGEAASLLENLYTFKSIPAGRHLWVSGVPGRQFLFNCHRAGFTDRISRHFEFTFNELMKGGGVGANYSNDYIKDYPAVVNKVKVRCYIAPEYDIDDLRILLARRLVEATAEGTPVYPPPQYIEGHMRVQDSREGWYAALNRVVESHFTGKEHYLNFDLSMLRPKGSIIKGFGGIASGPWALAKLLQDVSTFLNSKVSKMLTSLDFMEIDHLIASCVVAGNIRRSARMSAKYWKDLDIFEFINCKTDPQKHWSTNISVEVDDEFWKYVSDHDSHFIGKNDSCTQVCNHASKVLSCIVEGMMVNGEPGFINTSLASKGERGDIRSTNPCWTGDTTVWTIYGPRKFKDMVGKKVPVLTRLADGTMAFRMMRKIRKTREDSDILKVTLEYGSKNGRKTSVIRLTPDHNLFLKRRGQFGIIKVAAKDLKVGDSLASVYRYWANEKHYLKLHNDYESCVEHRVVASWKHGERPEYPEYHVDHIDENKQNNHPTNLRVLRHEEHNAQNVRGDRNPYHSKTEEEKFAFVSHPGNKNAGYCGQCGEKGHTKATCSVPVNHKVVAIECGGSEDVYNGVVDETHKYYVQLGKNDGILSANCGEIFLEDFENCNLGHVDLGAFWGDHTAAIETFRLMQRYLIRATFGDITDPAQRAVVDRNRRTGVGIFGFQAWLVKQGIPFSKSWRNDGVRQKLEQYREVCIEEGESYSKELGIPAPIKHTTVAPTGTIAKLSGTSEGIHPIFARYFYRRIRYGSNDPKLQGLFALGYGVEDDIYTEDTKVVTFPVKDILVEEVTKLGLNETLVEDACEISLEDMMQVQGMVQECYADNSIAFTMNFKPGSYTFDSFRKAILNHGPSLKGTTAMPDMSRPQMPYERISREEFEATGVGKVGQGEMECATGACPIK